MITKKALLKAKEIDILGKKQYKIDQERLEELNFIQKYSLCPRCGKQGIIQPTFLSMIDWNMFECKFNCKTCNYILKWSGIN